jgi:7-cyano-7-deazaguanine synthase
MASETSARSYGCGHRADYGRQRRYACDYLSCVTTANGIPAVVLLSGGLDSTTTLALATRDAYTVHALTFRYGQRHAHEIDAARKIAARYRVARHEIVDVDLRAFGGSALTADIAVPKDRAISDGIPITYVPARNTIFLAFALAFAEVTGAADIFIGVNHMDSSGYPDCRPEYIAAFQRLAELATQAAVEGRSPIRIRTPLIDLTKAQIIALGLELGVDYSMTTSCYDPDPTGAPCGRCDACQLRLKGFAEVGMMDPAR